MDVRPTSGFTLIELMLVAAIIMMLADPASPATATVQTTTMRSTSNSDRIRLSWLSRS